MACAKIVLKIYQKAITSKLRKMEQLFIYGTSSYKLLSNFIMVFQRTTWLLNAIELPLLKRDVTPLKIIGV